jgi:rhodanese-related sulfurtransferase
MYRGDLAPKDAFERLQKNPSAVLIDVRSQPEWTFVGVPQVDRLMRVSWQVYPSMEVNGNFVSEVKAMGLGDDTEILCICRSGARSASAATALSAAALPIAGMWLKALRATRMPMAVVAIPTAGRLLTCLGPRANRDDEKNQNEKRCPLG